MRRADLLKNEAIKIFNEKARILMPFIIKISNRQANVTDTRIHASIHFPKAFEIPIVYRIFHVLFSDSFVNTLPFVSLTATTKSEHEQFSVLI